MIDPKWLATTKTAQTTAASIALSAALVLLLLQLMTSHIAYAADWTVQQSTAVAADEVSATQQGSTAAIQAVNGIRVATDEDIIDSAMQSASFATDLSLSQSGVLSGSIQAVNFAQGQSIRMLDQSVLHSGASSSVSLHQDIMSGTGNIQAINAAHATNNVQTATQSYVGQALELTTSENTPADNIQAVNYLRASSFSGILTQQITVNSLTYENLGDGLLYLNTIQIPGAQDPGNDMNILQSVTVDNMEISPETGSATIIINHREM